MAISLIVLILAAIIAGIGWGLREYLKTQRFINYKNAVTIAFAAYEKKKDFNFVKSVLTERKINPALIQEVIDMLIFTVKEEERVAVPKTNAKMPETRLVRLYKILGIHVNATKKDIKKAYLQAAKKYHPDLFFGLDDKLTKQMEEKFRTVEEAYRILMDEQRKASYAGRN